MHTHILELVCIQRRPFQQTRLKWGHRSIIFVLFAQQSVLHVGATAAPSNKFAVMGFSQKARKQPRDPLAEMKPADSSPGSCPARRGVNQRRPDLFLPATRISVISAWYSPNGCVKTVSLSVHG